jgi:hypothetical protein
MMPSMPSDTAAAADAPQAEIPSRDVMALLGLPDITAVSRLVRTGKLTPTRRIPGGKGTFLFDRTEVERLAQERKAKLEATLATITDALGDEAAS